MLLVILAVGYSLLTSYRWMRGPAKARIQASQEIADYERRYVEWYPLLPARGVVGYAVCDGPVRGFDIFRAAQDPANRQRVLDAVAADRRFRLTQHALTPRVVVRGFDAEYLIGDWHGATPRDCVDEHQFELTAALENGARLYRRRQP